MNFVWQDYDTFDKLLIEGLLDSEARRMTGIDGSFEELYGYWDNESDSSLGMELWCKVVFQVDKVVAVILTGCYEGEFTVSEFIVAPEFRGRGIGSSVLTEFIKYSADILGKDITLAKAVIFPDNTASKRVFEKAGFNYDSTHPDGDAMYYVYRKETKLC